MMQSQCAPTVKTLDHLCRLTNRKAFSFTRRRNTCILTATALRDILEHLGVRAELMRVAAAGVGKRGAVVLGSDGDGQRRPAAGPGMWHGHLAVVADSRFLLDPTLDQIPGCKPFTGEVTDAWLRGEQTHWWVDGIRAEGFPYANADRALRYRAFPGRGGWKSAPDFKYLSHRRPIIDAVLATWKN